jgi:hypothetical protein
MHKMHKRKEILKNSSEMTWRIATLKRKKIENYLFHSVQAQYNQSQKESKFFPKH